MKDTKWEWVHLIFVFYCSTWRKDRHKCYLIFCCYSRSNDLLDKHIQCREKNLKVTECVLDTNIWYKEPLRACREPISSPAYIRWDSDHQTVSDPGHNLQHIPIKPGFCIFQRTVFEQHMDHRDSVIFEKLWICHYYEDIDLGWRLICSMRHYVCSTIHS
jgi:hypothetical protein